MPVIRQMKGFKSRYLGSRKVISNSKEEKALLDFFGKQRRKMPAAERDELTRAMQSAKKGGSKAFSFANPYARWGVPIKGSMIRRGSLPALAAAGIIGATSADAPKGKRGKKVKDKAVVTAGGALAGHTLGKVGTGAYAGVKQALQNAWNEEKGIKRIKKIKVPKKTVLRNARIGGLLGAGVPLSIFAAEAIARAVERRKQKQGKS